VLYSSEPEGTDLSGYDASESEDLGDSTHEVSDMDSTQGSEADTLVDDEDENNWVTDSESDASFDSGEFNDDDTKEFLSSLDPRYVCTGWGGECLHDPTEDIDFEFVYALHNFVATVEGQANAAKGDTMVLLDDSNSYWWLVRVVKDSTIGQLTLMLSAGFLTDNSRLLAR
jgi:hypothetical protein